MVLAGGAVASMVCPEGGAPGDADLFLVLPQQASREADVATAMELCSRTLAALQAALGKLGLEHPHMHAFTEDSNITVLVVNDWLEQEVMADPITGRTRSYSELNEADEEVLDRVCDGVISSRVQIICCRLYRTPAQVSRVCAI